MSPQGWIGQLCQLEQNKQKKLEYNSFISHFPHVDHLFKKGRRRQQFMRQSWRWQQYGATCRHTPCRLDQ